MATYISEDDKQKVLDRVEGHLSEIVALYTQLRKSGISQVGKCPVCGHEKGLTVTDSKNLFSCFKCNNFKGNNAISYLMKGHNLSFQEAVKVIADHYNILLSEPQTKKQEIPKERSEESYCDRMLRES